MSLFQGIHLEFEKKPAILLPTAELKEVKQVCLPIAYSTAADVRPAVFLYDTVRPGTPLSQVEGEPYTVVRSSVTGAISGEKTVSHPLYGDLRCVTIDCVPNADTPTVAPTESLITAQDILDAAAEAGVIDELDGVPLVLKLQEWQEHGCDFLVGDAVEVQPYSCSGWATLRSHAEDVLDGLKLAADCVRAGGYHIAACLSPARRRSLALRIGKKRLFQADPRYPVREPVHRGRNGVPHNATVCRIGVQACLALSRAVRLKQPHTHTVLTVAGDAIKSPQNLLVPFGTSVQEVLSYCGLLSDPAHLILGDLMTGVAAMTQDIPVLPGMTCLLALTAAHKRNIAPRTCIGCGRCAQICHAGLLPFEIFRRYENLHDERLTTLAASDCDGCGACSYICPCGLELTAVVQEAAHTDNTILLNLKEGSDA